MAALNFAAFVEPRTSQPRLGHYDLDNDSIQPLSFASGTAVADLYQVMAAGEDAVVRSGDAIPTSSVKLLAPISGRDVLAVGKNYGEHAKEFNQSGFDSSDTTDRPSHAVVFTKRATSIVAHGDDIYSHPGFTQTLDYEGELGVIVGKGGFRIPKDAAMDHVWGYTIINDVTAREKQRDHKQFYIGKSADTFCPMGPVAVAKEHLPQIFHVSTHVNGELRQNSTTEDLIFSIPQLIETLSESSTLQPGDVLATGTPAGVGIGKKPPMFLRPGDEVVVSITGLGSLRNTVTDVRPPTPVLQRPPIVESNSTKTVHGAGLTYFGVKPLHYKRLGAKDGPPIVFVHGLGGTLEYWQPLIAATSLGDKHALHLFDLEGHGLSPTSPLSVLSIKSFAEDVLQVFTHAGITSTSGGGATLVAHSMGCLVALEFAAAHPELVGRLVLVGPPPSPLPEAASKGSHARAAMVRTGGMSAIVDAVVAAGTSEQTKMRNPLAVAAVRLSLLGQEPEGYAKACAALAGATSAIGVEKLTLPTLIITGAEDKVSPPSLCRDYGERIQQSQVVVLAKAGHWHVFEDVEGIAAAFSHFIS
ncbi:putative protein yisK [Diplodia seriata]|uniref:Fumarylacetoacetate hydrolase n=1 Tax=Diplodia seriata TaxID=420778 RepID=A0A1S8BK20_9PEZI|nr:putative protein yisK [Diplodia seriata]